MRPYPQLRAYLEQFYLWKEMKQNQITFTHKEKCGNEWLPTSALGVEATQELAEVHLS
jgi:hypothetical protein